MLFGWEWAAGPRLQCLSKILVAVNDVNQDDAALVAFTPDGSRAAFLHSRMIERLAQSVEEIVQGCSPHMEFEESIAQVPRRIRTSSRVAPELYCIYFDLLPAVRRDDLDTSARFLR